MTLQEYRRRFFQKGEHTFFLVLNAKASTIFVERQSVDETKTWSLQEFEADENVPAYAHVMLHGRLDELFGSHHV